MFKRKVFYYHHADNNATPYIEELREQYRPYLRSMIGSDAEIAMLDHDRLLFLLNEIRRIIAWKRRAKRINWVAGRLVVSVDASAKTILAKEAEFGIT